MSGVMYVCPKPGCGKKGFDEPGGTKMVCRIHQVKMVQHEAAPEVIVPGAVNEKGQGNIGNDFRFRQPKETRSGTFVPEVKPPPQNEPMAVERTRLNQAFRDLTGQPASRAWSMEQLRRNVKFAEKQAAGQTTTPDETPAKSPTKTTSKSTSKKEQPA